MMKRPNSTNLSTIKRTRLENTSIVPQTQENDTALEDEFQLQDDEMDLLLSQMPAAQQAELAKVAQGEKSSIVEDTFRRPSAANIPLTSTKRTNNSRSKFDLDEIINETQRSHGSVNRTYTKSSSNYGNSPRAEKRTSGNSRSDNNSILDSSKLQMDNDTLRGELLTLRKKLSTYNEEKAGLSTLLKRKEQQLVELESRYKKQMADLQANFSFMEEETRNRERNLNMTQAAFACSQAANSRNKTCISLFSQSGPLVNAHRTSKSLFNCSSDDELVLDTQCTTNRQSRDSVEIMRDHSKFTEYELDTLDNQDVIGASQSRALFTQNSESNKLDQQSDCSLSTGSELTKIETCEKFSFRSISHFMTCSPAMLSSRAQELLAQLQYKCEYCSVLQDQEKLKLSQERISEYHFSIWLSVFREEPSISYLAIDLLHEKEYEEILRNWFKKCIAARDDDTEHNSFFLHTHKIIKAVSQQDLRDFHVQRLYFSLFSLLNRYFEEFHQEFTKQHSSCDCWKTINTAFGELVMEIADKLENNIFHSHLSKQLMTFIVYVIQANRLKKGDLLAIKFDLFVKQVQNLFPSRTEMFIMDVI